MQRLIVAIIAFTLPLWGSLNTATVWEVRLADGSNDNGCSFRPGVGGTDRSQQAAAHATLTILSTVHTTTTQVNVSILDYTVVAEDVGNQLNITGGLATAGRYEITAVDVGNNRWTLDRSAGTAAQTVVGAMGGGCLTIASPLAAMVAGNTMWVKNGATLTLTSTMTLPNVGNLAFFGYGTTRGDTGRSTITTATDSTELWTWGNSNDIFWFENFTFTNTATTRAAWGEVTNLVVARMITIRDSSFSGFSTFWNFSGTPNYMAGLKLENVEIMNSTGVALNFNSNSNAQSVTGTILNGVYVHDSGGDCIDIPSSNPTNASILILRSTIGPCTGIGIDLDMTSTGGTASIRIENTNFTGATAACLDWNNTATTTVQLAVVNSVFWDCGTYGINAAATPGPRTISNFCNAYGSNTTADLNNWPAGTGDVALTTTPWTDAANDDFSLNSTVDGGALLKGTGCDSFAFGTGFVDIGAVQAQSGGSAQRVYGFVQ